MLVDEGLEILREEDARALLARQTVGRLGITMGAMPAIFPVNYLWLDDTILFRTSPGSKLSAAVANNVVAFEVDDFDGRDRSGWSVLLVGRATVVQLPDAAFTELARRLTPYVDGTRNALVRIEPGHISGRRIVHDRLGLSAELDADEHGIQRRRS
ncbi:MAG TPA: pyridoxamine 5'-phosphate oxidase family protein [Acidimicrobiales bacterium]